MACLIAKFGFCYCCNCNRPEPLPPGIPKTYKGRSKWVRIRHYPDYEIHRDTYEVRDRQHKRVIEPGFDAYGTNRPGKYIELMNSDNLDRYVRLDWIVKTTLGKTLIETVEPKRIVNDGVEREAGVHIDPATGKPHRDDHICNQQCKDLAAQARAERKWLRGD